MFLSEATSLRPPARLGITHLTPKEVLAPVAARTSYSPAEGAIGLAGFCCRPGRVRIYLLIWRPALAEMVGEGRPWTVLMISLLSMPWR